MTERSDRGGLPPVDLQSVELLRSILESIGEGVVVAVPGPIVASANRAARELLGIRAEHIGQPLGELVEQLDIRDSATGERVPADRSPLQRALCGEANTGEYTYHNGRTDISYDLEVVATPVPGPGGEIAAAVVAMHDLTALRKAEREKDEFISIVSHELKTPLTPLKALAQLLRSRMKRARDAGKELDLASFDRNLTTIERQVDRMNALVNDLLEVSRAGRGKFEITKQEFDLAPVIRGIVKRYEEAAGDDEGRYQFVVDAPDHLLVNADQQRLEQVCMNLVGNAVKYSPRGGEIAVQLMRTEGDVSLTVRDSGIGIPAEDLPRLGNPFIRGSGRARTFAGMGIGLYLSKLVAEAHGGALEVSSEGDDKGTTARVTLKV